MEKSNDCKPQYVPANTPLAKERKSIEALPQSQYRREMLELLDAAEERDAIREALRGVLPMETCPMNCQRGLTGYIDAQGIPINCKGCGGTGTRDLVDGPTPTLEIVQRMKDRIGELEAELDWAGEPEVVEGSALAIAIAERDRIESETFARTKERCATIAESDLGHPVPGCVDGWVDATPRERASAIRALLPEPACECVGWARDETQWVAGHHPACPKRPQAEEKKP